MDNLPQIAKRQYWFRNCSPRTRFATLSLVTFVFVPTPILSHGSPSPRLITDTSPVQLRCEEWKGKRACPQFHPRSDKRVSQRGLSHIPLPIAQCGEPGILSVYFSGLCFSLAWKANKPTGDMISQPNTVGGNEELIAIDVHRLCVNSQDNRLPASFSDLFCHLDVGV